MDILTIFRLSPDPNLTFLFPTDADPVLPGQPGELPEGRWLQSPDPPCTGIRGPPVQGPSQE